jgi:dihydroflavonol-4-reductase
MPSILVTGASGFIGSFIVEEGIQRGFDVYAGIRKSSSKKYLQDSRINFFTTDFSNKEKLMSDLSAHKEKNGCFDYIIHCAGVTKCIKREDFDKVNFQQTKLLVDSLQTLDMVPEQFIYISTLSVFGPIRENDYTPIQENDERKANTAYGLSKKKSEDYIKDLPDFPYIFIRPTGVYGPRERDYYLMAKSIKQHIDFSVGYRHQDLTFIYVKDLVKVIYLCIEKKVRRRAYFVTDGGVYPSRKFSDLIQKEMDNPFVIHIKSPIIILKFISLLAEINASITHKSSTLNLDKYKIMKQRNWRCDMTPTIKELNFVPDYNLERGVAETIAWYKEEGWL